MIGGVVFPNGAGGLKHLAHALQMFQGDFASQFVLAVAFQAADHHRVRRRPDRTAPVAAGRIEAFLVGGRSRHAVTAAEGFGLPVIEAMACGAPVLSVAQGSVPEFATGAALLVPDSSVEHLSAGLARVIGEPELRARLSSSGLERARSITWRVTAERILDALMKAAAT